MLEKHYHREKAHLNFLYSNNAQIKKIYQDIDTNPIICDQEYLSQCIKIRKLFLKRIKQGMDTPTYNSYKNSFKELNKSTHLLLDNIAILLEQNDSTLIQLANKESNNHQYYCVDVYKNKNPHKCNSNLPPELSFSILNEILNRMLKLIRDYANKIVIKEFTENKDSLLTNIFDDEFNYLIYTSVLNEKFTEEFSYLEDTLYSDIYNKILNNLNKEFNRSIRFFYNYVSSSSSNNKRIVPFDYKNKKNYM